MQTNKQAQALCCDRDPMKAKGARVTRALPVGVWIKCADNSGAKELEIIAVKGYKGRHHRLPSAGVGDLVFCTVKKGDIKFKKKVVRAVIIRQKKEYRRPNGLRIAFEDNAAVLVDEKNEPVATEAKGPVAREAVNRFPSLAKICSMIV